MLIQVDTAQAGISKCGLLRSWIMSAQAEESSISIAEHAVEQIGHIGTLPEVTIGIIELVEDPSSTAKELHELIASDPALCTRALKVVNSAFYGLPRQIGSINRAISLLGLSAVKNIAISASMARLFQGGSLCPGFDARELWQHSLATATSCQMLTERSGIKSKDEAFLAGLIHDIGLVVEMHHDREGLTEVVKRIELDQNGIPSKDMLLCEQDVLGVDHQAFGRALCESWKFPRTLGHACSHHHQPWQLPSDQRVLPGLVYVSDRIVACLDSSFRIDLVDTSIRCELLDLLNLSNADVLSVRDELPQMLDAAVIGMDL